MNSKHFKDYEFECNCCGYFVNNTELKLILELVRLKFGGHVTMSSGTRCVKHNASVGGSKGSKHLTGEAADIRVFDKDRNQVDPRKVYDFLCELFPDYYGFAVYKGFTHVDVRLKKWRAVYAG
jgi:uncharacterized protein YcbK (DUF882 family)